MRKTFYIALVLFIFGSTLSHQQVFAQTNPEFYDYPQNHLEWYTIESEHFLVHFQEGNSRSAQVVSRISEEIFGPITELYEYEPDEKVSIVLKDREDYSNGAAYFFDNKIDIWLPALNTPLRGSHNWLRNVITHEYTHIIQIQKGMKRSRRIPAFYLQWLSYEDVRRPDVLYGYPNGLVTLPFATINIPAWLAEGTAQYQRTGMAYESWDSHRDMILRTRILSDTQFTLDEMGTFSSKTSIERETVYNQGFAFVIYLVNRFGEDILRDITSALGEKGVYTVQQAINRATGENGDQVYNDWIAERKGFYTQAVSSINAVEGDYVEDEGFYNFFPKVSKDGTEVAYLSNKGLDFGLLSLYIRNADGSEDLVINDEQIFRQTGNHTDAVKPLVTYLSTSFSFSPDGRKLVYSINKRNKLGEFYRDLYIYDRDSKKHRRLTESARIESPEYSPDGKQIAAVQYKQGTQNLVLVDAENGDITKLTDFSNGETVFTPVWHPDGQEIYFASALFGSRNIYSLDLEDRSISGVITDPHTDYRDPEISEDGSTLYYSGSPEGIFNVYSRNLNGGPVRKLTNVIGGAFMPEITENGTLYYSQYEADGYKIRKMNISTTDFPASFGYYDPEYADEMTSGQTVEPYITSLNDFDDTDLNSFDTDISARIDTGRAAVRITDKAGSEDRLAYKYEDTFSKFSFFPVLRFDNYSKPNGNNGALIKEGRIGDLGNNLIRDLKPGFYLSSRDVLDRLSIFGGLLVGVGSLPSEGIGDFFKPDRLINLDRDAFLIAEYRGLPFIKRSWSPTISVELYNLKRNVKNGLGIEEFPCTSCLPDTTSADISYDIWEAGLYLRSKLSRRSLLELGVAYSPYRVSTESFFSRELQQFITGSSSTYFKGTTWSASYTFNYYTFHRDADIAPVGLKGYLRYQYQPSELLQEYEIKDGALSPVFRKDDNHSSELHVRYGFRALNGQAFQARVRAFSYFNNPDDFFYLDYVGGFLGMRSYPFFALGGTTTGFTSLSYFVPLYKNITRQVGPYTIDKLYGRIFFEAGNGWRSPLDTGDNIKTGIGAEIRLAMNGYYLFPLKFFISTSYGFNEFSLTLPEDFITGSSDNTVTYGRQLLFHFGLTFDFELL
ncbi:hypothetical protein AB2B38_005060 [Balneola sp. MJW-20]|uniref:hypothetical protein n=1 Tax=Gracilimonas aurantiaca TaxID=3234185 RepID=UPI0034652D18